MENRGQTTVLLMENRGQTTVLLTSGKLKTVVCPLFLSPVLISSTTHYAASSKPAFLKPICAASAAKNWHIIHKVVQASARQSSP